MKLLRPIAFLVFTTCLHSQTPVESAWTILTDAASDKSHERREKALTALGVIPGNTRAQAVVEAALLDEREEVRAAAAQALGQMRATGSAPLLKEAIKDSATVVVFAAAKALFELGDPDAYQVYFAVLTGERKSGDALLEAQMKMLKDPKALTKLGLEAGIGFIPYGGVGLKVVELARSDTVSPIRAAAAVKLTSDPDPRSAKALVDAAKDEKWIVRAASVGAIARRNDPSLLPAVTPLLTDKNDVVRFNAAAAVIRLSR